MSLLLNKQQDGLSQKQLGIIKTQLNKYNREQRDFLGFKKVYEETKIYFEITMLKFPHKRIMNLNWRVFSKYIRKPGQNIFYMITLLQIIIALYIFLFY